MAAYPVYYTPSGRAHLAITSPDAEFVVSAFIVHGDCSGWHMAYTRREQEALAELFTTAPELRHANLFVWAEQVGPYMDGHHPSQYLTLVVPGSTGHARFHTGQNEDRHPVTLLTTDERPASGPVRLGREMYEHEPSIPAQRLRVAGAEYVRTGQLPTAVAWQGRSGLTPWNALRDPNRQLPPALADEPLPPEMTAEFWQSLADRCPTWAPESPWDGLPPLVA
ncbi:MAG TPA: hypothetical protein VHV49_14005 [Pseudonocardiaceae bacterium]|nr:hypothetical protein [Pseudonocardiaceae bacterium]